MFNDLLRFIYLIVLGVSATKFNELTSQYECYIQKDKGLTEVEIGTATAAAWIDAFWIDVL